MKTVFFDVDTQIDFLYPAGALYVPDAERLMPALIRLNRYAESHDIQVFSDMDAHEENDPEFLNWPPHCVAGTLGQRKPAQLLLDKRVVIPSTPGEYSVGGVRQIILEKQGFDCFTNPNLTGLLEPLGAERYVVYGVVTEYCVRCAAFGLLRTGKRVELVTDAIETLNQDSGQLTLKEFTSAGGYLTTVEQVCI